MAGWALPRPVSGSIALAAWSAAVMLISIRLACRRSVRHKARERRSLASAQPDSMPRTSAAESSEAQQVPSAVADAVRTHGVCVVEDAMSVDVLSLLAERINALQPRKKQNRRAKRWEHVHAPDAAAFQALAANELISGVVKRLLGGKIYLEKAGLLISYPGATAQRWHMDTPHLFSCRYHLPPHSITVFIPLCELHTLNGPTEFQLGTHMKENLVVPHPSVGACCPHGSMVVYDTRVMHRGGPNNSAEPRPMIYMTFSRVWYRDTINP